MICRRCQQDAEPHHANAHLCDPCVKAEDSRVSHYRQHNYNWIDVAREAELNLWDRQPGETDLEYSVWLAYRDAYPGRKPSYRIVAEQLGSTVNAIGKVGARWSFAARIQAWAKYCDEITLAQRTQEILDMNKRHVTMAATLNEKLAKAIDQIDPYNLTPREINALMKTATELEAKGRLNQPVANTALDLDSTGGEMKKDMIKTDVMSEVLQILGAAGQLQNFGVKQTTTTTTEVVVQND